MINQVICSISSICKAILCTCFHVRLIKLHGGYHAGKKSQTTFHSINSVKRKFLILLHILIVCQRNSLHGSKNGCQSSINTSCFSSYQLSNIRVLLLRHNTASGTVCIINFHKTVLIGIPENNLLGKTAEMHHNRRKCRQQFNHIISVRYRVHAVSGWLIKVQKLCGVFSVQRIGSSCKSSRAKRTGVHSLADIKQTASVTAEHFKICSHMMRQRNWLGFLEMGKAGHIRMHILFHDFLKSLKQ